LGTSADTINFGLKAGVEMNATLDVYS
jgi:hypothetical protein